MFTILKCMNIRLLFPQCSRSLRNSSRVADPPYFHSIIWYQFLMYCLKVHGRRPVESGLDAGVTNLKTLVNPC
jgi:hypothetical protein